MRRKCLLVFTAVLSLSYPAWAQGTPECAFSVSEITDLREPEFGQATVWDLLYAQDGMDVFSDLVPLDETTFVAAGSYTKDKEDKIYHPMIVKYDERLKPLWEMREETKEQRTVQRILKTKKGFIVLGDLSDPKGGNGIYTASYNDEGKPAGKPSPIYEPGGDLDAKTLIPAQDGGGYIIAAQFISAKNAEQQYGLLYKVSPSGNLIWKRSFKPGRSTVLNSVQATQDGNYVAAGQIVMEGGKSGGWLVKLDRKGATQWQKTYPRGSAATIQAAAQAKDGSYIVTGKARPLGATGKGLSAWIMKTDSSGAMLWQRFLKGPYDYEAPGLIVYEDGRASVLVNGSAMDSEHRSHARLLTYSPDGRLHHLEDFTDGQNAAARRLVSGHSGERIIVGYAQTSYGDKLDRNEAAAAPVYTYDGWLNAAEALDIYEDACAPPAMSPILP
jgi:hypothetical protein